MREFNYVLLFIFLITSFAGNAIDIQKDTLNVGYVGSEPFIFPNQENQMHRGIVFDIWQNIAFSLDQQYQLDEVSSISEGITAVNAGDLDVLIGPITINSERASKIAFSQPFYDTELALLAPIKELSVWDHITPFLSSTFLFAIFGLLLTLGVVGFLFWLVEGRHFPEDYPKEPIKCIGIGAWLAVVTMTTVGYGDYAPKTSKGRIVMGSWMIISLILATTFVAGIATTFSKVGQSEKTISSLNQLDGMEVAVPSNQKVMSLIRAVNGNPVRVGDVSEAYSLLLEGKVDAVLYDQVPLEYVFEKSEKENYLLTKKNISPQHYGFIFRNESDLKGIVDKEIIRMRESNEISDIVSQWITSK